MPVTTPLNMTVSGFVLGALKMDVTKKCVITGKYGFDTFQSNKFAVIEVNAKAGDIIKLNRINGIRYSAICVAYEHPEHIDHPIIDRAESIVVVGGEEEKSKRVICVIGK